MQSLLKQHRSNHLNLFLNANSEWYNMTEKFRWLLLCDTLFWLVILYYILYSILKVYLILTDRLEYLTSKCATA